MTTLQITHRTRYAYDRKVRFGEHRLMLRPRDAHDTRILDAGLSVTPEARVHWTFDAFGNSVALLSFAKPAAELVIVSTLHLQRYGPTPSIPRIARRSGPYPVVYDADDRIDLAPMMAPECPEDRPVLEVWIDAVRPRAPTSCLRVLAAVSAAIHRGFRYRRRESGAAQTPATTLARGTGSCRDFAFLFMEVARTLGFAARFVTGYLYDPGTEAAGRVRGGGSTHAWADVFVPGAGWIEFDPTNRIVAGTNLIRVATTRTPAQASPVSGWYHADGSRALGLEVSVRVTRTA